MAKSSRFRSVNRKNSRAAAAVAVEKIIYKGYKTNLALEPLLLSASNQDRRFIKELVSGVVRWYWLLDAYAQALMHRPLKKRDRDVHCILLVGLYQIEFMRVPQYASVTESVNATKAIGKTWAAGLVNAVLKQRCKTRESLNHDVLDQQVRLSHPAWIIERVRNEWPQYWSQILQANNQRPQMALRVNPKLVSVETMMQLLRNKNISARVDSIYANAIQLNSRVAAAELPGFDQGWVSIQGVSSQLVGSLMDVRPGFRVLDACAAPGGKTLHMLELCSELEELVAIDLHPARCKLLENSLNRVGKKAAVVCTDATKPELWWDGRHFDRILIDAPCSAFGVINKYPEIKHQKRLQDIRAATNVQRRLLENLLPLLAKDGKLVYTSCSILACENEEQIQSVIKKNDGLISEPLPEYLGISTGGGRQRLQGVNSDEGFYYASLRLNR